MRTDTRYIVWTPDTGTHDVEWICSPLLAAAETADTVEVSA